MTDNVIHHPAFAGGEPVITKEAAFLWYHLCFLRMTLLDLLDAVTIPEANCAIPSAIKSARQAIHESGEFLESLGKKA